MNHTIQRWGDCDDDYTRGNEVARNINPTKQTGAEATVNEVTRQHKWKPFGRAAIDRQNDVKTTFLATHEVFLEHPSAAHSNNNEDSVWGDRFCTMVQNLKEGRMRRELALKQDIFLKSSSQPKGGGAFPPALASTEYIPPHKRHPQVTQGYHDQGDTLKMTQSTTSIRVSNLSHATKESDLHDLFSRFGRISRVYLATTKDSYKTPRGFGFVTFDNKADAVRAKVVLQGHGYDHMILKLEWASQIRSSQESEYIRVL